jgi:dihydroorotase
LAADRVEGKKILIQGGRICDPANAADRVADVLIVDGKIAAIDRSLPTADGRILDARGLVVAPGLIDMHVHLRDPGQTHKEDIASGTAAAVRGGFTSVACMPNTIPPVDHPTVVEYIRSKVARTGVCRVYPIGAVTLRREGAELAPIEGLAAAGAVAFSDDGNCVAHAGLLRRAMCYAQHVGVPMIEHCEDLTLSDDGVMHEGAWSSVLGLRGIPAASEDVMVARDIMLAEESGCRLHVAHVSTAGTVGLIQEAKRRGVAVTAEVTPHHLLLTDAAVEGYNANAKMKPPLRSDADRAALRGALQDGTIDAVATDHAPHAPEETIVEFDRVPFGVVGLETALGLVLTHLVRPGLLSLHAALRCMSSQPATILGIPGGRLEVGGPADVVLIDLDRSWIVDPASFASKSRNTPFGGWELVGKPVMTFVAGEIRYADPTGVPGWVSASSPNEVPAL